MKKQAMDFSDIEKVIVTVKGQKVIIDSDVAQIYSVETKEVNQAVKNNPEKFPVGYILKLTDIEAFAKLREMSYTIEKIVSEPQKTSGFIRLVSL
jgi:predicted ester cyclase